jgi:hypothetical protein
MADSSYGAGALLFLFVPVYKWGVDGLVQRCITALPHPHFAVLVQQCFGAMV